MRLRGEQPTAFAGDGQRRLAAVNPPLGVRRPDLTPHTAAPRAAATEQQAVEVCLCGGLPAPTGFVVSTAAYSRFIGENCLGEANSGALGADPRIWTVTFTGSTAVGKILYRKSAESVKRLSLELGGHAPLIVFDDADLEVAVREAIACKYRNSGQTCVCTNRIYVQRGIAEAFTKAFAAASHQLLVGDPSEDATGIGPLVDHQGLEKVQEHLKDALGKGAALVSGGSVIAGLYFRPTVITRVRPDMLLMNEETFGPVAPIAVFDNEPEIVRLANETPYGLAAYVFTNDLSRAHRMAEALDYGIVGINDGVPSTPQAPFGGIKQSGIGREGGEVGVGGVSGGELCVGGGGGTFEVTWTERPFA